MGKLQLEEFNFKGMKSTEDQSTTYVLIQSFIKQLTIVVKQCFFHACNKSDHLQLRPEAAIILQFLRCLGNVTYGIFVYRVSLRNTDHQKPKYQSKRAISRHSDW